MARDSAPTRDPPFFTIDDDLRPVTQNDDGWRAAADCQSSDDWAVGGNIRLMTDVGGGVPLWDDNGRLPEDPGFLHGFIGLTVELVDDLRIWADAIDESATIDKLAILNEGERLRQRVAQELGDDFVVTLVLPRWAD